MLDSKGNILYVGKAKNLKKRVSSYFLSSAQHHPKTRALVALIDDFETIITATEYEAYVLESQLIKDIRPKYNIALKDDKSYPFIKITNEVFPRIIATRRKIKDGGKYFGPFPSIGSSRKFVQILEELFLVRDCKQAITLTENQPKCIKLDIGKCVGPCIYKKKEAYDAIIAQVEQLLSGKNRQLVVQLKKDMHAASEALEFEKAAAIRDKITKLDTLTQRQHVFLTEELNAQVWVMIEKGKKRYIVVQVIINGKLTNQYGVHFDFDDEIEGSVNTGVFHLFSQIQSGVSDIIMSENLVDIFNELPLDDLKNKSAKHIQLTCPKIGEKKKLVLLAQKNAEYALLKIMEKEKNLNMAGEEAVSSLFKVLESQKNLGLKSMPMRIIGFDISHNQGKSMVSAAVYFKNGRPYKSMYRRFTIRTVEEHSNDPKAIYESVKRRLAQVEDKKEPMPDLLLIDGGRGQLNFAYQAIRESGLDIPAIGLAKREEEIYIIDTPDTISLPRDHAGLRLCQQIRDEAHRFSNDLQRLKQTKSYTYSKLHAISGLGTKRINTLLSTYGSTERIKQIPVKDLAKVGRIGIQLAEKILEELA